jgi:GxxExxY protein
MRVHSALGPGLLEAVYEECLCAELAACGMEVRSQVPIPLIYRGKELRSEYRLDLLVEGKAIVEVKAVDHLSGLHESQLYTYLRMSGVPLGLLINFNVPHLRQGIRRRIFTPTDPFAPSPIT